jgi:hypothetical protein
MQYFLLIQEGATSMEHLQVEGPTGGHEWGLFGRFRTLFQVGVCMFLSVQFAIVIMLTIRRMGHESAFEVLRFPVEYLCPLLVALGFRARINRLEKENVLQADTANSIRDWIVALIVFMYASLMDIGRLH